MKKFFYWATLTIISVSIVSFLTGTTPSTLILNVVKEHKNVY
jgi:hypothetical protein